MKRLVVLVFVLTSLSYAQYTTSYQWIPTDLTTYVTGGTNPRSAWKEVWSGTEGTCKAHTISKDYEGGLWCLGVADNYVYKYSRDTGWVKQTAMGSSLHGIAALNGTTVYGLLLEPNDCGSNIYQVASWSGSTWNLLPGCLYQMQVGSDGTLAGTQYPQATQGYYSTNGGTTWTQISGNWTYISLGDINNMCGVAGGNVYVTAGDGTNNLYVTTNQPGFTVQSCLRTNNIDPVIMAVGSSGQVSSWNFNTGVWDKVGTSITVSHLTGTEKGFAFAEDSNGHIFHWNVYGVQLQATTSGTWDHCPNGPMNCPPGVYHQHSLQVTMPGGVSGVKYSSRLPSTQYVSGSSWDSTPSCDLVYGPDGDSACQPSVTGQDYCEASNEVLASPGPPPPPPGPGSYYKISQYYANWAFNSGPTQNGLTPILWKRLPPLCGPCSQSGGEWAAITSCILQSKCLPGTACSCSGNHTNEEITSFGPTKSAAIIIAQYECALIGTDNTSSGTLYQDYYDTNHDVCVDMAGPFDPLLEKVRHQTTPNVCADIPVPQPH